MSITKYSNPTIVFRKARQLYGQNVQIALSTHKEKKYMILNPNDNKWIHFGQMGYEDYTKHKDNIRRQHFLTRNKKWSHFHKYSAGYMAYFLLW